MNEPQILPDFSGIKNTIFITEGNPVGVWVRRSKSGPKHKFISIKTPEAALAWAKKMKAVLVYFPVNVASN